METYSEYLAHHGILGMRWGKRNGPPYPLNSSQMTNREKRLARKSIESAKRKDKDEYYDRSHGKSNKYIQEEFSNNTAVQDSVKRINDLVEKYDLVCFQNGPDYRDEKAKEMYLKYKRMAYMNMDADEYKQDEDFMEKVKSGDKDVSDYLIYEDWDQGNYPGNTYVMHLLDKGYDPVEVAKEVHEVWNDAREARKKATMDLLERIDEDTTPKKVVTYEVNGEKKSYRIENDTVDYVRNCLEELSDKKAPDSALWGIENALDSRGLSNLDVYRERLKNGFYEKPVAKSNSAEKIKGVSPLAYLIDQAGKYDKKSFDPELADLTLMEYEDVTGKTISDSEWSKIIDEYKKS